MKKALIILPVVGLLLVALAIAQEASQNISVTADVQPYYSVVFDYNTVDFGAVYPGFIPAPGNALGAYNVGVETNIPLRVNASRTPWFPYEGEGLLDLWFNSSIFEIPTAPAYVIETTPITVDSIMYPGIYIHWHAYWLLVFPETPPDIYSTIVTITYEPA